MESWQARAALPCNLRNVPSHGRCDATREHSSTQCALIERGGYKHSSQASPRDTVRDRRGLRESSNEAMTFDK